MFCYWEGSHFTRNGQSYSVCLWLVVGMWWNSSWRAAPECKNVNALWASSILYLSVCFHFVPRFSRCLQQEGSNVISFNKLCHWGRMRWRYCLFQKQNKMQVNEGSGEISRYLAPITVRVLELQALNNCWSPISVYR